MRGTTCRFQTWRLSCSGKIEGRFPIADSASPDAFVELDTDAQDRVIGVREWQEGHNQPLTRKPSYDHLGRIKFSEYVDPLDKVSGRNEYEYDGRGYLCARQERDPKGAIRFRTLMRADNEGRLVEETRFDGKGRMTERALFEYDSGSEPCKETRYGGPDGKTAVGFFTLEHDDAGRLVRRTWHTPQGEKKSGFAYTYDAQSRIVSMAIERGGRQTIVAKTHHDKRGKRIGTDYRGAKDEQLVMERPAALGGSWRQSFIRPQAPAA